MARILLIMAAALVVAAACSRPQPAEPPADFCASLQQFSQSLTALEQSEADTPVDDLRKANQAASQSWQRLMQAADGQPAGALDALDAAWAQVAATASSAPRAGQLGETATALRQAMAGVRAAYDQAAGACTQEALTAETPAPVAEPLVESRTAPAVPPEEALLAVDVYVGQALALDGTPQTVTLALHPSGAASLVRSGGAARDGSENAVTQVIEEGRWRVNPSGEIVVELDQDVGAGQAIDPIGMAFSWQAGQLHLVQPMVQLFGPQELILSPADPPGAAVEPAAAPDATLATVAADAASSAELIGVAWQLQQVQQASGSPTAVSDGSRYTLTLSPDGSVQAQADCSRGTGWFQADQGQISLQIDWPAQLCAQPSLQRQFMKYLEFADAYQLSDGRLILRYGSGAGAMTFVAAAP